MFPGSEGFRILFEAAKLKEIGYPVMLKATAGGGGKRNARRLESRRFTKTMG